MLTRSKPASAQGWIADGICQHTRAKTRADGCAWPWQRCSEIRGECGSTPNRRRRFRQGSLVRGTALVRRQPQFGQGSWNCPGVERTGAPLTARPSIRCWLGMAEGLSSAMSYQPAQQFFYQKRIHVIQHMHTAKRRSCCRRSFKDSENHPQIPPTNQGFQPMQGQAARSEPQPRTTTLLGFLRQPDRVTFAYCRIGDA